MRQARPTPTRTGAFWKQTGHLLAVGAPAPPGRDSGSRRPTAAAQGACLPAASSPGICLTPALPPQPTWVPGPLPRGCREQTGPYPRGHTTDQHCFPPLTQLTGEPPFRGGGRTPTPERLKKPELPHLRDLSRGHSGAGPAALGPIPWTLRPCSDHVRKGPLPFPASQEKGAQHGACQPREQRDSGQGGGGTRGARPPPASGKTPAHPARLGPRQTARPAGPPTANVPPDGQCAPRLATPRLCFWEQSTHACHSRCGAGVGEQGRAG